MKTEPESVEQIPLSAVAVAGNIRTSFDDEKLKELADSIRVREADDAEVAYDRIIENLQREDLTDEDQYRALKTLRDRGLTVARISKMTGLSSTTIQRVLVLETLKPSIRKRDDVSSYAKAFIARAPAHIQDDLAERVAAGAISSKQLGHEVMPAITEAIEDELFSETEKKHVIQRIARESSTDRPARSIVWQERGRKQLQRDGIDVQVASKQILKEMLDLSQRYQDKDQAF